MRTSLPKTPSWSRQTVPNGDPLATTAVLSTFLLAFEGADVEMRKGARKVQCSGDASGCQRCRRADIRCFYSAPKPPGRPRKVRRVEDSQPHLDDQLHQRVHYQHQHVSTPPVPTPGFFFGDFFGAGELMDQGMERQAPSCPGREGNLTCEQ